MLKRTTSRPSAYQGGASEASSPAEDRIAARVFRRFDAGQCVMVDVSRATLTQNFGPADPPAASRLFGRDNSILVPQSYGGQIRHPIRTSANGKPCLAFGAGGFAPNDLSQGLNGTLRRASITGPGGVEANDRPVFLPGYSRTLFAKVLFPTAGAKVGGIEWPSSGYLPGGTLIGAAGGNTSLNFVIDGNGRPSLQNRRGTANWGGAINLFDGQPHTIVASYNSATGVGSGWIDGVASGSPVTSAVDVDTAAGCSKSIIGGFLDGSGAVADRFTGIVFGVGAMVGADGEDPGFRSDVLDYLAGL